jgi:hypothetical protein
MKLKGMPMASKRPIFELARFAWGAPDRLELSGRFIGLSDLPDEEPALVISGADGTHRLPIVPGSLDGALEDGRRWEAVFAWHEPPVAFELAELELGDGLVVELPEPTAKRTRSRRQMLSVSRNGAREPAAAEDGDAVQQLRAKAELMAVREELRQVRAALERSDGELRRTRDDLEAERDRRDADAERYAAALAAIGDTAEQAIAAELREARELVEAKDVALEELRGQLAGLEQSRAECDRLRAELDQSRSALEDVRIDAERLLGRLSAVGGATGDAA